MQINIRNKKTYFGEGEYVTRRFSPLGNPFKITSNLSRSTSIYKYSIWLYDSIINESSKVINELNRLFDILVKNQKLNLICCCYPKSCHAQIIKQVLLNKYYHGTWLIDKEDKNE